MRVVAFMLLIACSVPLWAQSVVTSPGPTSVSVTIYRDPARSADTAIDLESLTGFALITETREVDLPKGEVTIRFEGVASGIEPATAMVFGVPVSEKNRDRQLLSQRGLLDAFSGQAVLIRRTDKTNGNVFEESGTIRSAPDGLILQTQSGFESLYCTGLDQTLLFPNVPSTLTAKPTLSVTTRDQAGGKQIVTLSYLASNFDWQANYVGELSADARHIDLLGWMTMASGDEISFVDANAFAVAGRLNKVHSEGGDEDPTDAYSEDDIEISYQCWPLGTTSSGLRTIGLPKPSVAMPAPIMMRSAMVGGEIELQELIVTANKRAEREDLGDLKLYRVPFAVTVAAQSQKQVAFLSKSAVSGEMIHRSRFDDDYLNDDVALLYRIQNKVGAGLGEALPAGQVTLFQTLNGRRMLVGHTQLSDKAVGEEVELEFAQASNVSIDVDEDEKAGADWKGVVLTVTNANPFPVQYEAEFQNSERLFEQFNARLFERKGRKVWRIRLPAKSERKLEFRVVDIPS